MATAKKSTNEKGKRYAYFLTAEITFTTPLLATNPGNDAIYSEYIANLATDEERAEEIKRLGLDEVDRKGMTVFLRDLDDPMIPLLKDYTWLGYLKARAKALVKIPNTSVNSMKAYIKEIDNLIEVTPRFQPLILPEGEGIGILTKDQIRQQKLEGVAADGVDALERPLRAETMQGDRVALSKSESVPIGTKVKVTFRCERKEGMDLVKECLDYGSVHGTGQWRNAGFGRFTWEKVDAWREEIDNSIMTDDDFPIR